MMICKSYKYTFIAGFLPMVSGVEKAVAIPRLNTPQTSIVSACLMNIFRVVVATKLLPQLWCQGWGVGTPLLTHAAKNCDLRISIAYCNEVAQHLTLSSIIKGRELQKQLHLYLKQATPRPLGFQRVPKIFTQTPLRGRWGYHYNPEYI